MTASLLLLSLPDYEGEPASPEKFRDNPTIGKPFRIPCFRQQQSTGTPYVSGIKLFPTDLTNYISPQFTWTAYSVGGTVLPYPPSDKRIKMDKQTGEH